MKRYLYIVFALLAGVISSCSNNEMGEDSNFAQVTTLKVGVDEGAQTRAAASGIDRYMIEVYSDATYTTAANVFGSTNKATSATGIFSMVLDRTQEYYCLLWADKLGTTVYTVSDLKAVTLQSGKKPVEAWQGKLKIEKGNNATLTTTLYRAVSKITLLETGSILAGSSLVMKFDQPTTFNVSTAASGTPVARTETIDLASGLTGPTTLATDIYVLSGVATADVTNLTFQMSNAGTSEPEFGVANVPLKANFNTNIKGHYTSLGGTTFNVTCDDTWSDINDEFPKPEQVQIGDFYMNDGTIVSKNATLTAEDKTKCIGIVIKVGRDASDNNTYMKKDGVTLMPAIKGYVLALYDADNGSKNFNWGLEVPLGISVDISSTDYFGYKNTQIIKKYAEDNGKVLQTDFPAAHYATAAYETNYHAPDETSGWFLPSLGEAKQWWTNKTILLESIRKVTNNSGYDWMSGYSTSSDLNETIGWHISFGSGEPGGTPKSMVTGTSVRSCLAF